MLNGQIVGYEKEKNEIAQLRSMLHDADRYRRCGVRIPRGLLLIGEPGVGKTQLARSIAGEGVNLIELRAATCCDDDAVDAVQAVFEQARQAAPAVLLLDELDKIAGLSQQFFMEDNDRVRKCLLQELDSLMPEDDVLVVATCNDDSCISEELIRSGRFDRRIEIQLPDEDTRKRILWTYFDQIDADQEFDMDALARNTRGFTGAKLECLANECGIKAVRKKPHVITEDVLRTVINAMEFGADARNPFDDFDTLHRASVHEAGHAFVALHLCPDSLYGASVLPQGNTNGHIRFVPEEMRIRSISEIENEVAVLLAGHVAERVIIGEYLVGSASDLENAVNRIHYLCTREAAYGYDTVIGGRGSSAAMNMSERQKMRMEEKTEKILTDIDSRAAQLIYDRPDLYAAICHALEEKYVLSRDELLEIKEQFDARQKREECA